MKPAILVAAGLLVSGCAAKGKLYPQHAGVLGVPDSTARVVVYRTRASKQFGVRDAAIKVDGNEVGSCSYAGYAIFDVPPGAHVLATDVWDAPGKCEISVVLSGGHRYFYQVQPRTAAMGAAMIGGVVGAAIESARKQCGGAFAIDSVDEDQALAELKDLRESR